MNQLFRALQQGHFQDAWVSFRMIYPAEIFALPAVYIPLSLVLLFLLYRRMTQTLTVYLSALGFYYAWGTFWVTEAGARPFLSDLMMFGAICFVLGAVNIWVFLVRQP